MNITHAFLGVPVTDFSAAYGWYERLFDRPADMVPKPGDAVWHLAPRVSIYVVDDPGRAGSGLLTIAVPDLEALAARVGAGDVAIDASSSEPGPRRLVIRDGDGNSITFFEDPEPSNN